MSVYIYIYEEYIGGGVCIIVMCALWRQVHKWGCDGGIVFTTSQMIDKNRDHSKKNQGSGAHMGLACQKKKKRRHCKCREMTCLDSTRQITYLLIYPLDDYGTGLLRWKSLVNTDLSVSKGRFGYDASNTQGLARARTV